MTERKVPLCKEEDEEMPILANTEEIGSDQKWLDQPEVTAQATYRNQARAQKRLEGLRERRRSPYRHLH